MGEELVDPAVAALMDGERTCQVNGIQRSDDRRVGLASAGEEVAGNPHSVNGSPERGEPLMDEDTFVIVQVAAEAEPVDGAVKLDPANLAGVGGMPPSPLCD